MLTVLLTRAFASAQFFGQRFDWAYGLTFKPHADEPSQYADMADAAIRQARGYFGERMRALLLDLSELADKAFVRHGRQNGSRISPACLVVETLQAWTLRDLWLWTSSLRTSAEALMVP